MCEESAFLSDTSFKTQALENWLLNLKLLVVDSATGGNLNIHLHEQICIELNSVMGHCKIHCRKILKNQ